MAISVYLFTYSIYMEGRPCQEQRVSRVPEGGHAMPNHPFFISTFFGRLDVLLPPISYYVLCVDAFVLGHVGTHVILRSDRNREPASCRRDCNGTRGIVI